MGTDLTIEVLSHVPVPDTNVATARSYSGLVPPHTSAFVSSPMSNPRSSAHSRTHTTASSLASRAGTVGAQAREGVTVSCLVSCSP